MSLLLLRVEPGLGDAAAASAPLEPKNFLPGRSPRGDRPEHSEESSTSTRLRDTLDPEKTDILSEAENCRDGKVTATISGFSRYL